jgi:hypothetical protein
MDGMMRTERSVSDALRAAVWRLADARERGVFRAGAPLGRLLIQEHAMGLMALCDRVRDLEEALRPLSRREAAGGSVTRPAEAGVLAASGHTSHAMVCAVVSLAELWAGDTFRDGGDEADEAVSAAIGLLAGWADDVAFLEAAVRLPEVARMEARLGRRWGRVSRFASRIAAKFARPARRRGCGSAAA